MRRIEQGISSSVVDAVLHALQELGYDPRAAIARAKAAAFDAVVPSSLADALMDDAAKTLGDDALGLSLARKIPIGSLGTLDYALCTSATLGDGLGRVARFYSVVTQRVKLDLVEDGDRAALIFRRDPGESYSRHWCEFALALIAERIRQTLGKGVAFTDVTFVHAAPADASAHDAFFGTRVRFGEREDRLGFARDHLGSALRTAAGSLAEVLEARMREMAPPSGGPDPITSNVRRALVEALDTRGALATSLEAVAGRLRVSKRTLQRELHERGTSHKEILDEVRRERAVRLLEDDRLSVADVSTQLGFSEPSAFFRAFRRWTGTSPKASRR